MKRQSFRNIIMNSILSKPKYEPINNVEELLMKNGYLRKIITEKR